MKSTRMKMALGLLFLGICSSALAQSPFEVKGKVEGIASDSVILFKIVNGEPQEWLRTKMSNGEFSFKGRTQQAELCRIQIGRFKYPIRDIFVDAGTTRYSCTFDSKANRLLLPTAEGTPIQDALSSFNKEEREFLNQIRTLGRQLGDKQANLSSQERNAIKSSLDSLSNAQTAFRMRSIKTYSNSAIGAYIIQTSFLVGSNISKSKRLFEALTPEAQKTHLGLEIADYIAKAEKVDVGATIPHFTMKDVDGKTFDIASMKGKVYVLDFWASWCGPCRKENPNMVRLYNDLHPKGLEMIGVSLDKDLNNWKAAVEKDGLTWTHISDLKYWDNEAAKLLMINAVPTTIVVGRDGKIVARGLHGDELRKTIEQLLNK